MATRSAIQEKEMAAHQKMTLRVILTEADIRKVILNTRPTTVKDLIDKLKESLGLDYNCSLQYQDPDFNYELCNLTDIADLPEKPTLKVIPILELLSVSMSDDILNDTHSTADTEILSRSSQERQKHWPEQFEIPNFSVDVAYRLRQADLLFFRDGTPLKVSKELKHEILERLAESIYTYTAYPDNAQFENVAAALINKHPCLQERGSTSRCGGWKNSLKFKMGNYRTKCRRSGCLDVAVNAGKRGAHSAEGEPAKKNIKKAKKGELNYLPNFPEGFDQSSLEGARKDLVDEMQKREPNGKPVKQMMDLTFALRRKEVVDSEPAISTMMERWPALFIEDQIYMEFRRIVGKDLKKEFFDGIDRHSPRLVEIFRCKRGIIGQQLTQLSQETKTTEPTDIRTMMLRGLPILLQDNPNDFFKACFDSDDDDSYQHIDIGILLVEQEGAMLSSSMHLYPASLKIVIEGKVVMGNIEDLPRAVCLLFGLAYALHLNYPKSMKHTFQFIQQYFEHVEEAVWAVEVLKETGKPVAACMCIGPEGDMHGVSPGDCAVRLVKAGAQIIGVNCHFDPMTCVKAVKMMKEGVEKAGLKAHYMVQPLAYHTPDCSCQGFIDLPEFPFGLEPRILSRWDMHQYAREAYNAGIFFIGGCCGFEPYHIRAVAEELAAERGFLPAASEKHGPWGAGLEMHTKPWVRARARRDYWENLKPASGRPLCPSMSAPDSWGVTKGHSDLMQQTEATSKDQLKELFVRSKTH